MSSSETPGSAGDLNWAAQTVTDCPIALAAELIGDRWSLLVLRELAFGVNKFDAVQEHLGISRRTLTERLETLVQADIVQRQPYRDPGQRSRHRYELTASGEELLPLFMALGAWGEHYRRDGRRSSVRMAHAGCGASVFQQLRCTAGHDVSNVGDLTPRLRSQPQR